MKRALLAAGAALFALTLGTSARAEPPAEPGDRCLTPQEWARVVHDKSSGVAIKLLADIQGLEARQVVARVNAEPPRTQMAADHVVVLGAKVLETGQPAEYVLVAFFN